MGNFFSKLKRRFRARNASQQPDDREARSAYLKGLLQEVTEKSLLIDASKLNSLRRSRQTGHRRYWKSPFESRAHFPPALISICINRDLGIGEITSLCHRFRFEDMEERNRDDRVPAEQNGCSGSGSDDGINRDSAEGRRGRMGFRARAGERQGSSDSAQRAETSLESEGSRELDKLRGREKTEERRDNQKFTEDNEPDNGAGSNNLTDEDKQRQMEHQKEDGSSCSPSGGSWGSESETGSSHSYDDDKGSQRETERQSHVSNGEAKTKRGSKHETGPNEFTTDSHDSLGTDTYSAENTSSDDDLFGEGKLDILTTKVDELDVTSPSDMVTSCSSDTSPTDLPSSTSSVYGSVDSDDDEIKQFPAFVTPLLNKDVRIRLQFHKAIHSTFNSTFKKCEPVHLWRHVKYIDARFLGHPYQKRLKIMLEESHGSRRKPFGTSRRSRPLFPRAIIVNTCPDTPGLYVAGKEFSILLAPPLGGARIMEDGRMLYALGTYVRYLDTDQNYLMLWRASIVNEAVLE